MLENRVRRGLLPAVALAVVLALGGSALAQEGRTLRLLAIGNSGSKLRTKDHLSHAAGDAESVAARFRSQEGKLFSHVVARTLMDEQATTDNICRELRELQGRARPGDLVVVVFVGHGGTDKHSHEWGYETRDWNGSANSHVKTSDLRTTVGTLPPRGVQVVVLLDTCHAGALNLLGQGVVVFAACLPEEEGSSLTDRGSRNLHVRAGGLFTTAVLEGLDGKADTNGDGIVTLSELDTYVANRVDQLNARLNKRLRQQGYPENSQRVSCGKPPSVPSNLALVKCGPKQAGPRPQPQPVLPDVIMPPGTNPGR